MKYYVKKQDGMDGPFNTKREAEAHVRRCEYDVHKIKYEYLTERDLGLLGSGEEEEE